MSEQESPLDEFGQASKSNIGEQSSDLHLPEVGEIPDDWSLVTVEDISDNLLGGGTPSKSEDAYWGGDIPWASVKDLNGIELLETEDYITESGVENSATNVIPPNSIIISTRMTVGEPFINKVEMAINQDMKAIIPNRKRTNTLFLVYSLWDKDPYLKSLGRGTTVDGITTKDLLLTHLGLPPLEEQRKIASVLYTVDQAIQQTEEIFNRIERLKKGFIQDALTGEFSRREMEFYRVGPKQIRLPNNWNVKPISEIADIKNGNRIVKGHEYADCPTDYPFIRIVDMEHGTVSTDDIKHLKPETAQQMQRGIISSDDVYITVTGRVGDAGTIPSELDGARFTDNAAKLFDLDGVNPEYLSLYLRSKFGQDEVHRFTVGSTQPKLSMYRVEKMEVIVPSIEEQKEIVDAVDTFDKTKFRNSEFKDYLNFLKYGLMQDLLSGEVRTHDRDIEIVDEVLAHG